MGRGALSGGFRQDDHAERSAEERDDQHGERHSSELIRADVDLQDEAERDDPERLRESDQGFPKYFPQDDRVARDRRDEDLLAEILLPISKQRDESERRRLPHGLR